MSISNLHGKKPVLITAALLLLSSIATARNVYINGQKMNNAQLNHLDRISCIRVPDGHYWLNYITGLWGYQGGNVQGHISERCNRGRPSLSERGLLYSPGELLR